MSQKFTTLVFCAIFIAVLFLSTAYIITHTNHEHDLDGPDNSCATCLHLAFAENYIYQPFVHIAKNIVIIFIAFNFISRTCIAFSNVIFYTPVTLKVMLNN